MFMFIKFVKIEDKFHYQIQARNGQVMLTSKAYPSYLKCVFGWRTVQRSLRIYEGQVKYRWATWGD